MPKEVREVKAGPVQEGLLTRFFEVGKTKFRLDFSEPEKEAKLPRYFQALLKIVFRGRNGEGGRLLAILATLYQEGVVRRGEKIRISRGIFEDGAFQELKELSENLAKIYGEENIIENEIEVFEEEDERKQGFEGEPRKEFDGKSAEEFFFREILLPELLEIGGEEKRIIPQLEFSSLFPEAEKDSRRVDFFVSGEEGRNIVFEVDDATHKGRDEKDEERDRILRENKIRVMRILDSELEDREKAKRKVREGLKGLLGGSTSAQEKRELKNEEGITVKVKRALKREKQAFNGTIYVGDNLENVIFVQEVEFPWRILNYKIKETEQIGNFSVTEETKRSLEWLVYYIFGFKKFREGQLEAILRTLEGKDSIVLLPTGAGKSIVYQLLALIMPGAGVIVEPLRALMEDQVQNLERRGIDLAVNLSEEGRQRYRRRMYKLVEDGAFSIIYMTPERLQIRKVRELFYKMREKGVPVSFLAIDEAHCVSEWGHDFRVSYLNLPDVARKVFEYKGKSPRVFALTGTASDNVLRDMERDIGISEKDVVQPGTFDRPEIHFRVVSVGSGGKLGKLEEVLRKIKEDFPELPEEEIRGIVFCVYKTSGSDFGVEAVSRRLMEVFGEENVAKYHGGDEKAVLRENARRFKEDRARFMVATKAFGMGIDKENIRFTIHFGITNSIEAFYQEAGRAGRDGKRAMSYVILSNDFPERNRELLSSVPIEEMRRELKQGGEKARDDVNRILFLHEKHYDKRRTLRIVRTILERHGKISSENEEEKKLVARNKFEFEDFQKALYRLKTIGVVRDYTIFDFANNEFSVLYNKFEPRKIVSEYGNYVARYQEGLKVHEMSKIRRQTYKNQEEFILSMVEILLDFTISTFEKSRRRAILSMVELAETGAKIKNLDEADKEIRRRILNYLGITNKELLKRIFEDKKFIREAETAVFRVRENDEERLLAETKRELSDFPEHPGLLLLAGFLEAILGGDIRISIREIKEARNAAEKYGILSEELFQTELKMIEYGYRKVRDEEKFREFIERFADEFKGEFPGIKEKLMKILPERFTYKFQGEKILENLEENLREIKFLERNLWTGKN